MAAADVSVQAKVFMVDMNAATSVIITKSPYMVRTSFTVWMANEELGKWAYKNGIRKAYTLVDDYGPGWDGEAAFQKGFKDSGGEIVGSARYPTNNLDFSAFLQRAKDSNPDAIYIWVPGGTQPAAIGKAIAERGIDKNKVKILGQGELTFDESLRGMGDAGLGLITAFHYDYNHQSAMNKKFVADYTAEFHRLPDMFSVGGYDGMHVIYETLNKTKGSTDAQALVDAAKGMKWESPRGPMMIDPETRDVVENIYIRKVEKVNGKLVNVDIDTIPNAKDPWNPRNAKK
jgi:branched-chain amino acid transport system substrate-binding protein